MSTVILSKENFIGWLDKNISDNQVVLMTRDMTGTVSVNEKTNQKKVTFSFAADAFKRKTDIGHIAFGQTPCLSFCICNPEQVSDSTKQRLKEAPSPSLTKVKLKKNV
jgi:hypothetical protein